jgi:hypothetical protein
MMMPSSNHHSDLSPRSRSVIALDLTISTVTDVATAGQPTIRTDRADQLPVTYSSRRRCGRGLVQVLMVAGCGLSMAQHTDEFVVGWVQAPARVQLVHGNTPLTWLYNNGDERSGGVVRPWTLREGTVR